MKTIARGLLWIWAVLVLGVNLLSKGVFAQSSEANFSTSIEKSTTSIAKHLDAGPTELNTEKQTFGRVADKVISVVFPVLIVVGVLVAMIGLYSLLTNPDKIKDGMNMILYGVIGILLLYSARYLSTVIFADLWMQAWSTETPSMVNLISNIYNKMLYPFLKLAIYFSLGVLVIIMMSRVFTYITSQDDGVKKKALGVVTWSTVGMLIITGAKQIVEAVYGKQDTVLKWNPAQTLSEIGTTVLNPKSIPIIFSVINWALGIISLVLLILIIWQTYQMLTKPDDESTFKSLKQTIIYALWGLILIGAAYLLANLLIIN